MPDKCKQVRNEPFSSPNNYDIEFDVSEVPSNVQVENAANMEKRLQKLMPLGKIIHVNFNTPTAPQNNMLNIMSKMNITKEDGELLCEVDFK